MKLQKNLMIFGTRIPKIGTSLKVEKNRKISDKNCLGAFQVDSYLPKNLLRSHILVGYGTALEIMKWWSGRVAGGKVSPSIGEA